MNASTDSTSKLHACSVCGALTPALHLGVGCRACTVFFRRATKLGSKYECKTGEKKCVIEREEGASCKGCRQAKYTANLEKYERKYREESWKGTDSSFPSSSGPQVLTPRPLMDRLARSYKTMCQARITCELAARNTPITLGAIATGEYTIVPSDYDTSLVAAQIFIQSLFDFCNNSFDEFDQFDPEEKQRVVKTFYEAFGFLEHSYRNLQFFPKDDTKCMSGYTSYVDSEGMDKYFEGKGGDVQSAIALFKQSLHSDIPRNRRAMMEAAIDDDELVAAFGIELFNSSNANFLPSTVSILDGYRKQLHWELHAFYREIKRVDDYAAKLARLYLLISKLKAGLPSQHENFEMYRMMDVVEEDSLVFQMYKTNIS